MTALEAMRFANMQTILENPMEITVTRTEYQQKEEDKKSGGREKVVTDLPSFLGRLVPAKRRGLQVQNEAGPIQIEPMMLIAPWDAELQHGTKVEDVFTAVGVHYRITRVIPRTYESQRYAIHATLEEVT